MRRVLWAGLSVVLMAGIAFVAPAPVSADAAQEAKYLACARVFPDPHAYWPSPANSPNRSPYAKGNAECASADFVSYQQMIDGMTFMESRLFPRFVQFLKLERDFGSNTNCSTSTRPDVLCSAGLPRQGVPATRVRSDLYMVRVTDEASSIPESQKKHFVFPLSIHGIERAGAEAGVRAAEDLATWGYCEAVQAGGLTANGLTNCAQEAPIPHPLIETQPAGPENLTTGGILKRATIYFVFANADGWRRGDPDNLARFFMRYNGNGVDLNRDWPALGFVNRPYTPWSEPETRGFGKVLRQIKSKWDGGIDLHGQLIDRAFSFTLMGASERDYAKDQRILQFVKGAWADASRRLDWHPQIEPNDSSIPQVCQRDPVQNLNVCNYMYGVQWGTVWDTINYQVTGSFGDWIDSPIGLDADGIDNEMSMSHLSNCGIGSCYLQDYEQAHVDGNKSLVYAMVNYTLLPENTQFEAPGKVAYLTDPARLSHPGSTTPTPPPNLSPQPDQLGIILNNGNNFRYNFQVFDKDSNPPYYNGGLEGRMTAVNIGGISGVSATSSLILERRAENGEPPIAQDGGCGANGDDWEEVNRYFNQASTYAQAGQAVHANSPQAGEWRVCVTGGLTTNAGSGAIHLDVLFSTEKAWENPGQLPYSASNVKFFDDLAQYMDPGQLVPVTMSEISSGAVNLNQFNSLVIADRPHAELSQLADPRPLASKLKAFVAEGGNLVLTDGALQLVGSMGFVAPANIARNHVYAGYIGFTSNGGSNETYTDPLAANIDQPGAAEGSGHRHQTYEPVPLGFDIGSRTSCSGEPPPISTGNCTSPVWTIQQTSWQAPTGGASNGRTVGQIGSNRTGFGELRYGDGRVRIVGALLPMPTERYFHPLGLADYALTYSGYQVLKNTLQWDRPPTDLSIQKLSDPDPVLQGDNLTYTIKVGNNLDGGNDGAPANEVTVTDQIPAETTLLSASTSQGSCSGTATVICKLGSLDEGLSATVTLRVRPNEAGSVSNTATVSGNEADPNMDNNSATTATLVSPADADLSVRKTDRPDPVRVGKLVYYTVAVKNAGPRPARSVTLTDVLPPKTLWVSMAPTQGNCERSGRTITCVLGDIEKDQTVTVIIKVRILRAGKFQNIATVAQEAPNDPNTANNTASQVTTVRK